MNQQTLFPETTDEITQSLRVSPRVTLRPGDQFRVRGGPVHTDRTGEVHRVGLRGVFEFRAARQLGLRTYVEAFKIEGGHRSGSYVLFVAGRAYRGPVDSWIMKPYRVVRRNKLAD